MYSVKKDIPGEALVTHSIDVDTSENALVTHYMEKDISTRSTRFIVLFTSDESDQ